MVLSDPHPPAGVIDWLHLEASRACDPAALLTRMGERLVAARVPLESAVLEIATLHPLMAGSTYEWRRDRPEAALEVPRFHDPFAAIGSGGEEQASRALLRPAGGQSLSAALTFSDGSRHSLTFVTDRPGGFDPDQTALLDAAARAAAAPLEILALRQMLTTLMATYLGRRTGARVLAGAIRRGDGESVDAVLWYSDLRGFTALAQGLPRDAIIALLNAHFERLVAPIKAFGGEVLKFVGDGLLAIFPIAEAGSASRACAQALRAVRAARAGMAALNGERQARGEPLIEFGTALHLGDVMYGNIGAPDRLDFTVIGATVNLASRLESLCKRLHCPVLASAAFAASCEEALHPLGAFELPGVEPPVDAYTLRELSGGGP